eukprot:m.131177 g.131177  ORF g.131177 m.131177 type:complete len:454 (+) comp9806_c0_seq5:884-2245(+)
MDETTSIITAGEAEMYVEHLAAHPIKDIGSPRWMQQHDYLERLNMQAHVNAAMNTDEYVLEALVSYDKLALLVHDLISIEMWRNRVYPELKKLGFAQRNTMTPYIVLFHEATVVNLLETVLYHREACTSLGDAAVDLLDYCHRRIVFLNSRTEGDVEEENRLNKLSADEMMNMTGQEQLEYQTRNLPFDIAVKSVSILRYLTDFVTDLPLSTMTRMLNTHDMPCALVPLVCSPPWTRHRGGEVSKYIDGKWVDVPQRDRFVLTKTEAQVWLALYNLLMEPECRRKYEFNSYNKSEILKLRSHFNDVLIDQLPNLGELRRALEELSVMEPPAPETSVILEQLPEIFNSLLKINDGKWEAIAELQRKTVFSDDQDVIAEQAKRLAKTYNLDTLDALWPEDPKCALCGEPAVNRCSRCKTEWYCRRQCQVEHWSKHKEICNAVCQASASAATTDKS